MKQRIHFCTAPDGVRLAYAVSGGGAPLVKTANWLSHLEFDWDSPVWRHWLAELSRGHTLVRYDERGCGLSDREVQDFSLDAWVSDLETVAGALNLKRFPLLGMSRGAAVAVAYAARHPERVSRLVLLGGFARGRFRRDLAPQEMGLAKTLLDLIRAGWGQPSPAFRQVYTTLFIPRGRPEQVQWFNDLQRVSTSPENAARLQAVAFDLDVSALAAQVVAPTLVLHASDDAVVPFAEGRLLASLIPGARFVPLSGNNHVLLEDEPAWPRFLEEVRAFLGEAAPAAFPDLTAREREILDLIARGASNDEIAAALTLSPHTVRNHITSIFGKLQVANRAQAIVRAREAGLGRGAQPSGE